MLPLLVADQHHHQIPEARQPADDRRRRRSKSAVAVQLEEVVEHEAHVVERVRPFQVARELNDLPGVARCEHLRFLHRLLAPVSGRLAVSDAPSAPRGLLDPGVQVEQGPDRPPEVLARLDEVEHAVLQQELGGLEALGQLLADRLLDHRGPAKPMCAPGSAISTSPSVANEALTPP